MSKLISPFLSKEDMKKLTTPRLLAYKKTLITHNEWTGRNTDGKYEQFYNGSDEWQKAYDQVREVLNTREHVEKKK